MVVFIFDEGDSNEANGSNKYPAICHGEERSNPH
jgi:hypothetical protein